jgi:cell volume regulation protein A
VSWAGLRGAVPIILAIYPLTQGVRSSEIIFDIVFFVVILSVLLQGTTLGWLAKRLRLSVPAYRAPAFQIELASPHIFDGDILLFRVDEEAFVCDKALRDLPLPGDAPAMLIVRDQELVTPRTGTVLRAGDYVYFLSRERDREALERLFSRLKTPPAKLPRPG